MRVVFAGTPDFAAASLRALLDAGHDVAAVYTQPDRPSGRGRRAQHGPVARLARDNGIALEQPESLRNADARERLASYEPEVMIVAAYGLILPQAVLEIPEHGCLNVHASLLPRWRGAAPIQRAVEAGDRETGVCIMQMEEGLDTGPVFHRLATVIEATDTGGSVHDRLAVLGADALLHCLGQLSRGELPEPEPQDDERAVYAPKLSKAEAELDFARPAMALERKVRAFNPWPVAWCVVKGRRLRIWRARVDPRSHDAHPGALLEASADGIVIATGQGRLQLLEVQPEGGRRMTAGDFLNARSIG